ncbi:hypothetical protein DPMN_066150 [Dreissena polymorpha]|uniref:Uncharacterized protein n=1 Tax=Dreissena polymorpha TaxID=45954 RepID=A0A9D3YX90_DREPO|nr:hypothetical protein DPMN_066150 [Dreissena polymorpha]
MLAFVPLSECGMPVLAFNGATPWLSVFLLCMKLENYFGLDEESGLIIYVMY